MKVYTYYDGSYFGKQSVKEIYAEILKGDNDWYYYVDGNEEQFFFSKYACIEAIKKMNIKETIIFEENICKIKFDNMVKNKTEIKIGKFKAYLFNVKENN